MAEISFTGAATPPRHERSRKDNSPRIPQQPQHNPNNAFITKWSYSIPFNDDIFIGMAPATTTQFTNITRVYAPSSSTTIPATFLPALHPGQTSDYTLHLYTTDDEGNRIGTSATDVTLSAPVPTTVTFTRTLIEPGSVMTPMGGVWSSGVVAQTPAPILDVEGLGMDSGADGEEEDGLSTGTKAGIGIGVAYGAVCLLAIGGVVVYRRRQRRNGSSGVSEKSPFVDQTVDMSGELQNKHGAAEVPGAPRPSELPVPATGRDRQSRMRFELGG
ncbi:hypothetical protein BJX62DRAFT_240421 [Aspergillus germanicus]